MQREEVKFAHALELANQKMEQMKAERKLEIELTIEQNKIDLAKECTNMEEASCSFLDICAEYGRKCSCKRPARTEFC